MNSLFDSTNEVSFTLEFKQDNFKPVPADQFYEPRNFEVSLPKGVMIPEEGLTYKAGFEGEAKFDFSIEILSKPVLHQEGDYDVYTFTGRIVRS